MDRDAYWMTSRQARSASSRARFVVSISRLSWAVTCSNVTGSSAIPFLRPHQRFELAQLYSRHARILYRLVRDEFSIPEPDYPPGVLGDILFVRDDNDRLPLFIQVLEDLHDLFAGP